MEINIKDLIDDIEITYNLYESQKYIITLSFNNYETILKLELNKNQFKRLQESINNAEVKSKTTKRRYFYNNKNLSIK